MLQTQFTMATDPLVTQSHTTTGSRPEALCERALNLGSLGGISGPGVAEPPRASAWCSGRCLHYLNLAPKWVDSTMGRRFCVVPSQVLDLARCASVLTD